MNSSLAEQLHHGLVHLGIAVDNAAEIQLLHYLELLHKWNQAYNLTAIRALPDMVTKHLLDSCAILPFLEGHHILDVGTGAGLPGIPIALLHPQRHVVLLDSNGKKTRFLKEVQRQLKVKNITIVNARAENYHAQTTFDTVVSRAFSDLQHMIQCTKHLLSPQGIWLAMKGLFPQSELTTIPDSYCVQTHVYQVPELNEHRCAVIIRQKE